MEGFEFPETFIPGFHNEADIRRMPYHSFGNTGIKVSQLSLGAAGFSDLYGEYSLGEQKSTLLRALKAGINYIDTAPWYGLGVSEKKLGECLEGVPRKSYYLATKIGRYEKDPRLMFDFSAQKTKASIQESLRRLKIDYVDVLQIHDVEFAPSLEYIINETFPAIAEIVREGKAKFVGITGYPVSKLADLYGLIQANNIKIDMVLSYARMTLFDDTLQKYLLSFKGLGVVNAAGLGMGLLTSGGPQPWHPAPESIKSICEEARNYCGAKGAELARLAMHDVFSSTNYMEGPHTHLVGLNSLKALAENLDVLLNGLTPIEVEVLVYLKEKVFSKLTIHHWENIEITKMKLTK